MTSFLTTRLMIKFVRLPAITFIMQEGDREDVFLIKIG